MAQTRRRPRTANPRASHKLTGRVTSSVAARRDIGPCPPGGCTPDDRCPLHRDAEPVRVGDLLAQVLTQIVPYGRPRLRVIRGGKR